MRRLVFVFLVSLIGWLPSAAHAQDKAPVPSQGAPESYDFGVRPVLEVAAGAVTGVIVASALAGSLIVGSLLWEGAPLVEALESGTGLKVPLIGASAVLGGFVGHFLFNP